MYYISSDKTQLSWNIIEGSIPLFINYLVEFKMMIIIIHVNKRVYAQYECECSQEGCSLVLAHQGIFKNFCSFVNRLTSAITSIGLN